MLSEFYPVLKHVVHILIYTVLLAWQSIRCLTVVTRVFGNHIAPWTCPNRSACLLLAFELLALTDRGSEVAPATLPDADLCFPVALGGLVTVSASGFCGLLDTDSISSGLQPNSWSHPS